MNDGSGSEAIDPRILDEAADWLMELHAGDNNEANRIACAQWQQRSPEHARAWIRAERLLDKLGALPAPLSMQVLDRPAQRARRRTLGKLSALLLALPAGWLGWRALDREGLLAGYRTATGERRELQLEDGSLLTMNTASALDLRFSAKERLIHLHAGEILVRSAHDPIGRALRVRTAQGHVEALGTRFTVRQAQHETHVAVLEGAVRIEPRALGNDACQRLEAGRQVGFTSAQIGQTAIADATSSEAWVQGMLLADNMPLGELTAELARYRHGIVECDEAVARLRITGAFPIDGMAGTDRSLAMLAATYPVQAELRLGGLWVRLTSRPG